MHPSLSGLVAAPFTAFHSDTRVSLEMIPRQARSLSHSGVSGAFVCGTTGEGASLTSDERRQVAEAWRAAKTDDLALAVHVGHNCLAEACELARHAEAIGVDAIATIAPNFFKPSLPELVSYCALVAASAPNTPFYYYHMPAMTGVNVSATAFLAMAQKRIPNLAGIKFTHEDLMDFARASAFDGGRYNVLFGRDEILLASLSFGATGAVGSTYNYMAPVFNRIISTYRAGELVNAARLQQHAIQIIEIMSRHGGLPAGKAMMRMIGLDCGPMRLPMPAIAANVEESLQRELKTAGFFDICSAA